MLSVEAKRHFHTGEMFSFGFNMDNLGYVVQKKSQRETNVTQTSPDPSSC